MIYRKAVEKYLSRSLRSFEWCKTLTHKELDRLVADLKPRPAMWDQLDHHQKVCFLIGLAYPWFLFFMDIGTGKTFLTYALTDYFLRTGMVKRMLVFVPRNNNIYSWEDEASEHVPHMNIYSLDGPIQEKWNTIRSNPKAKGVFLITYQGFLAMVAKKQGKKKGWVIDKKAIKELQSYFQGVVFDESSWLQRKMSKWARACRAVSKYAKVRFALTGTPFGKDPTEMFTQFLTVDGGETLGPTLGLFRAAFFKEKESHWKTTPDYVFDPAKEPLIRKVIQNRSLWWSAEECIDLPKLVHRKRVVYFPDDMEAYYKAQMERIRKAHNYQETKNAFLRMRQIASGWIGVKDDDLGVKAQMEFQHNPKLDELLEILDELLETEKVIVFCVYVHTGQLIAQALKKKRISHERLWGGAKDKRGSLYRFKRDPKVRVLVTNTSMGAWGLNLQVAKYMVVFESPTDPKERKQMIRRIQRRGQSSKKIFLFDLIMAKSVDEKILKGIEKGYDLFKRIVVNANDRRSLVA